MNYAIDFIVKSKQDEGPVNTILHLSNGSTVEIVGTELTQNMISDQYKNTLVSCEIGSSVTSIGNYAFEGCYRLLSVTIPESVTSIGSYAFSDCSGLTSIIVENGNSIYDSRDNCNAIIETATNTLIAGCKNTTIPNSVTSIGGSAFEGCSSLTSVTIPNSVISIGNYAFEGCYRLLSVTIGNSVTSIGYAAFRSCSSLTSVTIPNSVTSIGSNAFKNVPHIEYHGSATGSPWGAKSIN